jgi:hypothetical protein
VGLDSYDTKDIIYTISNYCIYLDEKKKERAAGLSNEKRWTAAQQLSSLVKGHNRQQPGAAPLGDPARL